MNELTGIVGAWLMIVAFVVMLDVGPGLVRDMRVRKPKRHGRHRSHR